MSDAQLREISARSGLHKAHPLVQDASVGHADAWAHKSGPSPPAPAGLLATPVVGAPAAEHAGQLEGAPSGSPAAVGGEPPP
eukprot:14623587-Alexandrium_andersonii.AAC.1